MTDVAAPPDPPQRPRTSAAAGWLSALVAIAALTGFCCVGLGTFSAHAVLRKQGDVLQGRAETLREKAQLRRDAEALLDEIEQRLESMRHFERAYPPALPEAPPEDPWGTALRYERATPDRAWLTSAGPDHRFGTFDDLVRELSGR